MGKDANYKQLDPIEHNMIFAGPMCLNGQKTINHEGGLLHPSTLILHNIGTMRTLVYIKDQYGNCAN
jgi:hypothetical protein